jgi:hypothetical protein
VAVCIGGETMGVGFRKAAEMYWRWWVWLPFVIALVPIAFTLFLAAIELTCYAVIFPLVLIGVLLGYDRSASSRRVSGSLVYLGFAFFVAGAAHDSAQRDAALKPATQAGAAMSTPAAHQAQPMPAPTVRSRRFDWWTVAIAVLSFCGGVAKNAFSGVSSRWVERVFDERKRVVIYGPNDRPR